eukprot:7381754-Prymnesium_polylepis.1
MTCSCWSWRVSELGFCSRGSASGGRLSSPPTILCAPINESSAYDRIRQGALGRVVTHHMRPPYCIRRVLSFAHCGE